MSKKWTLRIVRERKKQLRLLLAVCLILLTTSIIAYRKDPEWLSREIWTENLNTNLNVLDLSAPKNADFAQYKDMVCNNSILTDEIMIMHQVVAEVDDLRDSNSAHSLVYDAIFKTIDPRAIVKLSFQERCDLYFNKLYEIDPHWRLDPNDPFPLVDRNLYKWEDFRKAKWDEARETLAEKAETSKDDFGDNDAIEEELNQKYSEFWNETMLQEQRLVNSISHYRIYNKCFVTGSDEIVANKNSQFVAKQQQLADPRVEVPALAHRDFKTCSDMESRIYRWLSKSYPIYERWDGSILVNPPVMKDYINMVQPSNAKASKGKGSKKVKSKLTNNNYGCFVTGFKDLLNGKGIVFSIGDQHVDETCNLMRLLRALKTELPVQIVYKDDLSKESKAKIVNAARDDFIELPDSFKKVHSQFPDDYMTDKGLPPIEVWFVDVKSAIDSHYHRKFNGYSNKFLATFFNSFEEYILIDADTVPLKKPEYFFEISQYKNTGAYFYKDRSIQIFDPESESRFFQKMSPSLVDNFVFDFDLVKEDVLQNEALKEGMHHYMESGLVVVNRAIHFNAIMTMLHINFYELFSARVWGDKEIFWLGFMVNGEEYHMNKFFAAAIGEIQSGRTHKSQELCAAHPGHIAEDGVTLEWINSGFAYCGQSDNVNFEEAINNQWRYPDIKTSEQYESFYRGRMDISQALIPPYNRERLKNTQDEPEAGWRVDYDYCGGYMWCAYSSIGGKTSDGSDNSMTGTLIDFNKSDQDMWAYLGDVWFGLKPNRV
ncbi:putative alpha-1,3-mannosyltransferase Mnn1p [[Candida] anglica]